MKAVLKVGETRARLWKKHMSSILPEIDILLADEDIERDTVEFAIVWKPEPGWLATFPNLKCIISIGAGVDHILCDPHLPADIPIIRTTGKDLSARMREYIILQVLRLHRRLPEVEAAQRRREWCQIVTPPANESNIGIMGLGNLGADCANSLAAIGFNVAGWARSAKSINGVSCFVGDGELAAFLARTETLICMLPLTPKTAGILNSNLFRQLPKGANIINVARGQHLVDEDLLAALDSGQIGTATLDVFHVEPLPADHVFWSHPSVLVTPHIASLIEPETGGERIAENLRAFIAGEPVVDLVPAEKGY